MGEREAGCSRMGWQSFFDSRGNLACSEVTPATEQRWTACLRGSTPERAVRALSRHTTEREQVLGHARRGDIQARSQSHAGNATARVGYLAVLG